MNCVLFALSLLFSFALCAQTDINKPSKVLKADSAYLELLNAHDNRVIGNSILVMKSYFWYNHMPLTSDSGLLWNVKLEYQETGYTPTVIAEITLLESYLYAGDSVYCFTYNDNGTSRRKLEIPGTTPRYIVVKYYDSKDDKVYYLKSEGPFRAMVVQ